MTVFIPVQPLGDSQAPGRTGMSHLRRECSREENTSLHSCAERMQRLHHGQTGLKFHVSLG